jgi:hypothetical protein
MRLPTPSQSVHQAAHGPFGPQAHVAMLPAIPSVLAGPCNNVTGGGTVGPGILCYDQAAGTSTCCDSSTQYCYRGRCANFKVPAALTGQPFNCLQAGHEFGTRYGHMHFRGS